MSDVPDRPVTLITGTSRGLGRHLAEHYLARGHQVVGCSRAEVDWRADGYEHHAVDVRAPDEIRRLFVGIRKSWGRLDHLINNAGVASMNHSLVTPASTVERVLETNVAGTFLFSREAAKLMKRAGFGRIVNLTTVAVPLKLAGEAIYASSKAAVESLTGVMAREFAPFGVTVNAVGPTAVDTDLIRGVPESKIDDLLARLAIPRRGEPADVAHVVDFFLSKESGMVTGQVLYLGGV
ncbi:MAG: SDR family oxidoreductase [Gemmatimonadota bacterium]